MSAGLAVFIWTEGALAAGQWTGMEKRKAKVIFSRLSILPYTFIYLYKNSTPNWKTPSWESWLLWKMSSFNIQPMDKPLAPVSHYLKIMY